MKLKKLNKNITTTIAFQIVNILYGLVLPRIIIITYGSELNGLVSAILYLVGYIKIVEAGLTAASIRQFYEPIVKKDSKKISDLFQSVNYYYKKIANYFLSLSLVVAIVYTAIIDTNINSIYIFFLVMVLSLSSYFDFAFTTKYYVYFLSKNHVYKYQLTQILSQLLKVLIVLIGSKANLDILVLLLFVSLTVFVKVYLLAYFFKKEEVNITKEFQLIKIDQRNSVLSHQLLGLIIYNSPVILISILINATQASIFAIYTLIFSTFYSFFTLIYSQTLLPQLGHAITEGNKSVIRDLHEKFNKNSTLIILPIMLTTVLMFKSFIELYTKGADVEYYHYTSVILFSMYTLINCLKIPYQTLINANGDFKKTIKYSVIEVVIFMSPLILLFFYHSINIFIIALLLSSLYKFLSLKIYVNTYIIKETHFQHYYQIVSISTLLLLNFILIYIYNFNIGNIIEWILVSIVTLLLSIILSILLIVFPEIISRKLLTMNT